MADNQVATTAAAFLGRQLGEWAADKWGRQANLAFDKGKGLTGPLGRAIVDTFVTDRLVGAVWPSAVVLAVIVGLHGATVAIKSPEAERVLVGLVVLLALAWSAYGIVQGSRVGWLYVRVWLVTGLPASALVRMLLFQELRARHRSWQSELSDESFGAVVVKEAICTIQARLGPAPERTAFMIADHLAPIVVRHLAARLAMVLLPVIGALLYYRFAIYPDIIQRGTGGGPWSIVLYPLAASADLVFGSELRAGILDPR